MTKARLALIGSTLACLARVSEAQNPSSVRDSTAAAEALPALRATLVKLVALEEMYWGEHQSYGTNLKDLGVDSAKTNSPLVSVLGASKGGWSAVARSRAISKFSCVIFVGDAGVPSTKPLQTDRFQHVPATQGKPVCDEP